MSMIITNDFPRFLSINLSYGSLYEFIDLLFFFFENDRLKNVQWYHLSIPNKIRYKDLANQFTKIIIKMY